MRRRDALKLGLGAGVTAAAAAIGGSRGFGVEGYKSGAMAARLTIAPLDVELAPGVNVRSIAFDGAVAGPQVNYLSGAASLELRNECDSEAVFHSSALIGPLITIPARTCVRALLRAPSASASSFVLKHCRAYCAASGALASGVIVSGGERVGTSAFDQLQVLSIHRWQPRRIDHPDRLHETSLGYDYASFNDKLSCASEPIKVRYGDRVRFHFANTSTSHGVTLGLPQHRFLVVALDGHEVPMPRQVERIYLGPAESVDALVTMDRPGRWILGATHREDRVAGLGRLVEYAGATGQPVEAEFGIADWDYSFFGCVDGRAAWAEAARVVALAPLQLVRRVVLPDAQLGDRAPQAVPIQVCAGERYRSIVTNLTRDPQPLHLLGHDVELVRVAGQRTAGIRKDVVTLPSFTRVEFEFEAGANEIFLAHNRQVSLG